MLETPITDRGLAWADDVLKGRVPACKRVVQAVRRFKKDLKRQDTDDFPFVFDAEAAEHICAFIELFPHVKGTWAARNETIRLAGWQAFLLGQINGWRHCDTGVRRFRTAYIEVPRKNGKSSLMAPLGVYFLSVDGEPGAEVFSAASSSDQARIVFDAARVMLINGSVGGEPLAAKLGLHVEQHKIKSIDDEASVFRAVASQTKSQDGKNPHCAIIDELHEHQKRDVWDAMASALGARDQPLMVAITTAGHNTAGICYEQRVYVQRLLTGDQVDNSYFGMIFEADEGDEPGDPATWAKANPNLGVSKSEQYLQDEWNKAQASPQAMGEFLRKHLDIWTSVGAAALDMELWRGAEDAAMRLVEFAGARALIGVDLAIRHDFSSVVAAIPDGGDVRVFSWHFLPEDTVKKPGNEHYLGWAHDGWVMTTPGAMLDLTIVQDLVLQLAGVETETDWTYRDVAELGVEMITADPTFAAQMAATWEAQGLPVNMMPSRARNMNEPFQRLIGLVEDGRVITDGNPVLAWMAGNTLMKQVQGGDMIYPAKETPEAKIDGITALINALWPLGAVEEEPEGPSIYQDRGILVI